jgi:HK97 family phage portal protein
MFGLKSGWNPLALAKVEKAFPGRTTPPTLTVGLGTLLGGPAAFASEVPRPQNYDFMERKYGTSAWVYICVSRKARDLASAAFKVMHVDPDSGDEQPVPYRHPLARILRDVNPWMTTRELLAITSIYLDLTGNCFWLIYRNKFGIPVELYPINPAFVRIYSSSERIVHMYGVWHYGTERFFRAYGPDQQGDMIHFRLPNPSSDWMSMFPSVWGIGPLEGSWNLVTTDEDAVRWNRNLVRNDGRPTGLLTSTQDITPEQSQQASEDFRKMFSGPEGAGKVMVMGGDLKYQRLGVDARQLDWVKSQQVLREEIIAAFGLNSAVLGMHQGNIGRRDESHRDYWEATIVRTSQTHILPPIQEFLSPEFGADLLVTQDFGNVRALQEDEDVRSQFINRYWQMGIPINDLIERFKVGLQPVAGGDIGTVINTTIPLITAVGNAEGEPALDQAGYEIGSEPTGVASSADAPRPFVNRPSQHGSFHIVENARTVQDLEAMADAVLAEMEKRAGMPERKFRKAVLKSLDESPAITAMLSELQEAEKTRDANDTERTEAIHNSLATQRNELLERVEVLKRELELVKARPPIDVHVAAPDVHVAAPSVQLEANIPAAPPAPVIVPVTKSRVVERKVIYNDAGLIDRVIEREIDESAGNTE